MKKWHFSLSFCLEEEKEGYQFENFLNPLPMPKMGNLEKVLGAWVMKKSLTISKI